MEYLLLVLVIGVGILGFFLYQKLNNIQNNKDGDTELHKRVDHLVQNLTQNNNLLTKSVNDQLNNVSKQMNERLKENTETIQRQHRTVGERLDNAAKAVTSVTSKLSKIEEGNKRIFDVGKDISSLQELLKAPKIRGNIGEFFLADILAQTLPQSAYALQYAFKNGDQVDAIIRLQGDNMIPIDSKFPLENFNKMIDAKEEKDKKKFKKTFFSDVKKRVDEIAGKYIKPAEGTFDFALMYIPAENVYYEIMVRDSESRNDFLKYSFDKKVIPVSPNTFFIYMQTILLGLKGFQVEKQAKNILKTITHLKHEFGTFEEGFKLVGKHLSHARNSYDSTEKKFDLFGDRLIQADIIDQPTEQKEQLTIDVEN